MVAELLSEAKAATVAKEQILLLDPLQLLAEAMEVMVTEIPEAQVEHRVDNPL